MLLAALYALGYVNILGWLGRRLSAGQNHQAPNQIIKSRELGLLLTDIQG